MEEKILISIEIPKPEGEEEVDKLTRKITDLQIATANLQKQNNELIKQGKQNTQEYVENTRQIEINKQKIGESISARKGLISSLAAEDNSIKALNVRNAELKKQRDLITTATVEGRAEIARLNAEINKNNDVIKENVSQQEKQRLGVGGYLDALDKLVPGLGATATGFINMAKSAAVFLATPIGLVIAALGAALFALTSYFKGSEEGQNRLNKIIAIGSAIFEQFMNIVEDLGEALFDAFTNPKQAAIDFANFIKENIQNRFQGMLELIPKLGQAIDLLFAGEFTKAGKVAADAALKVVLGVENATDKINGLINSTIDLVNQGIENGQRLADFQAKIDADERKLIVDRAKTSLEVSKLRAEALKFEGDERKKVLQEAIALEESLAAREVALAKTRLANAELLRDANGDDKEALKAVAEARAEVFAAEATAFSNSLRFRKEIAAIDEATAKEQAALLAETNKMLDDAEKLEIDRQKRIQEALIATEELRLEQAVVNADSLEERINREIELETFKTFALLENTALLEAERQLILEKSQANINAIIVKGTQERVKKELVEEEKLKKEKDRLRNENLRGVEASADAAVDFARQAFGNSKGVAIAQATINTIMGVTRALSDYIFPYSLIVGALVGAAGAFQISKIASTKAARGMVLPGGILRGRSHAQGGIPFTVQGQGGFEAEGGEAIINKKSTRMFRPLLSKINEAGGGVAFARGGVTRFATGSIVSSQTRAASSTAESRTAVRDAVLLAMENMPPTIVTVEDINARQSEVSEQTNKALVA
jgi:hypothetical protein